jgi:hypothetical protein
MTQKISPFLEGKYGWEYGESGWNSGMDENLLKFSYMFDGNIDSIVSSLPTAVNGQAVFLTTDNRLYFAVGTTWYSSPVPKWFQLTDRATGTLFQFDGTSLVEVETSSELSSRVDAIELTVATLGSAAFEDSSYFATQGELEVASAQANAYTDEIVNKKGIVSVLDYITNTVDGITSNQSGIVAAVSAALSAGADLLWPAGTYVSDANIPNFHSVRHIGAGVIKRGSDTFKVRQAGGQTNTLYVSTSGDAGNDGLSPDVAMLTGQQAADAYAQFASERTGPFRIKLGAGIYNDGIHLSGVPTNYQLLIEGSGKTETILDGTGAVRSIGVNMNGGMRGRVANLTTRNFRSSGIAFQNESVGTIDTCDVYDCSDFGMNASDGVQLKIVGDCYIKVPQGGDGIRYYHNSQGTVGDGTNPVVVDGQGLLCEGLVVRNSSQLVCMGNLTLKDFVGKGSHGAVIFRQSFCEFRTTMISGCSVGIEALEQSTYTDLGRQTSATPSITFTNNTVNERFRGFSFRTFDKRNTIVADSGTTGRTYNESAYDFFIDSKATTGIQCLTDGTSFNIDVNGTDRISIAPGSMITFVVSGTNQYRMNASRLHPATDNNRELGGATFRWSTVYAGTGAISTSDGREKQQIRPIDDAALRAWGRVEYVQYKFNDAVERKGGGARWHFGLIAQRVKEAFEAEGLDAFEYGLLCYDEWDETPAVEEERDEEGNITVYAEPYRAGGNRYGIRYEEALALECAYLRSKIDRL